MNVNTLIMASVATKSVYRRFAQLSDEDKEAVVNKVKKKLTDNSDDKEETSDKSKDKAKKEKPKSKDNAKEEAAPKEEEPKEEPAEEEETDETTDMSTIVDGLVSEVEAIKSDGQVTPMEVLGLIDNIVQMVSTLLAAKPGRAKKADIVERVAARGLQVKRKDKDLMQDTGGTSKGRDREPEKKPPRDDVKKRHRTKRKTTEQKDPDTDKDKDLKAACIHPLDRTAEFAFGIEGPEENYYRRVWASLVNILATANGISEKDHAGNDKLHQEVDSLLRTSNAMSMVDRFEEMNQRPQFCAECLYANLAPIEEAITASRATTLEIEFDDDAERNMADIVGTMATLTKKVARKFSTKYKLKWIP
jgi:hypothetical protein